MRYIKYVILVWIVIQSSFLKAQQYPVDVQLFVTPPYQQSLRDYWATFEPKMQVYLLLKDLNSPVRNVALRFSLEDMQGQPLAQTASYASPFQTQLTSGVRKNFSNIDLKSLLAFENLQGVSENFYNDLLPEGAYFFCLTAYDVATQMPLSAKARTLIQIRRYTPPLPTLPAQGEVIAKQSQFQHLVFQWMLRDPAPFTQYEFTLKEVWDNSLSPEEAFISGRLVYQGKVPSNTILYGPDKPILLENKRYVWKVRAFTQNPNNPHQRQSFFHNNGESEAFYFDYVSHCEAPKFLTAITKDNTANIRWSGEPVRANTHSGENGGLYKILYREKGKNWKSQISNHPQTTLAGLKRGRNYIYKVGIACGLGQPTQSVFSEQTYLYSTEQEFVTPHKQNDSTSVQCGVKPEIRIKNREPLQEVLGVNETFTAGDFPVTILRATGSNGIFSGEGYVQVPYLLDTKIKVKFDGIKINSERQLFEGKLVTTYDKTEKNVQFIQEGIGEVFGDAGAKTNKIDFEIAQIKKDANGRVVVIGKPDEKTGVAPQVVLPAGSDYQLSDALGKTWTLDEKGEVTSVGEKADTQLAQNQGKNNLPKGQAKPDNFEIPWDFSQSAFAFDASGDIPYKALVKGKNDVFQVVIKQKDTLRYSFHFQTDKGLKVESKKEKEGVFEISRKGLFDFADEELWVVAKNTKTEKEEVIGKCMLVHLTEKEVNVTIVPITEGLQIDTQAIQKIYAKVGVKLTITTDKVFPVKEKIDTENAFGDLSTYSPEQQAIIAWYKSEREVKSDTYYVFVGKQEGSQAGYMRLGGQFGFVMDANERTIAHELGHGIFKLEHPFKKDKTKKGTFKTLMDYAQETTFAYSDWKQINDPKLRIGFFEEQSDGEYIIKKLEYVVCIPRVLIDKNRVYEDLDGRKILFKNGAYPFAFVAQDPKEHSGQVAGVFYKGEMYLPYYYTQDEKHAESYRLYKGGLKQDSLPKEAYEIITEDVKPLKIGVDNKEYITFNGISQNIKGKLCSGIPTISNVLAIGEVTSDEISLYNSQIAKSKEKIGVNTFVLMTKDDKRQNVVEKFLSSPEDDEVFIWANYEGGQWVVKRISFAGCVNTHPNLAIVCSMKAALSKAGFTSKMMLANILDALSEMVGYLEIPEHYYNPELPNYNPTLYYISHIDVNAIALKIADFAPNKNIPETYFAIKCGIWNGLVGQVKDLPDFMSDLLTGETSFTMIMEGLKKMDFFCTESKGDNVCLWSMIKEAHQGNQYQIAHQVGKDISEVLTIALSFAKVGKLAKIAKVADVLDPIHHLAKYAGKGVTVVFDKSTKAVRFVFDNLKFIEKYELKIRFGTNKLYAGLPLPDINLKKKLDELSQKDLENLISDQNGIKIIEVDGNLIPVGNEENINKIIVATDNFLNSIDKKTLEKLKNVPGFDKVITDMAQHWKKFKGGKFQLEYATKLLEEGASIRFEVSNLSDDIKRIYDIRVEKFVDEQFIVTNLELKNWSNFYPETIKNQFVKDLQKMGELGSIQWIFNKTNNISDISVLKTNVIKALKKADGTPIEELESINFEKAKKLFNDDLMTEQNYINRILKNLENDDIFNQIFEIAE